MRARLKSLRGKDVPDLSRWAPPAPDDFGLTLVLEVGPLGLRGREEFELMVASPRWLRARHGRTGLVPGRGMLLAFEWDYPRLREFLARRVEACTGRNWPEVARKVGRLALWEGEDAEVVALR
ncbi:MAG TPA: immunity 8 family protein [Anaeromyxobacteraceae bacterium]|nr:immunity 8 family protein [Anaeromyxobacteraceae bacterium]